MNQQYTFFIYLLERYAEHKNRSTPSVLNEWETFGITQLIMDMYELYHVKSPENAFDDIDAIVERIEV